MGRKANDTARKQRTNEKTRIEAEIRAKNEQTKAVKKGEIIHVLNRDGTIKRKIMAREIEFRGLIDGTFMCRKLEGWAHGYYYYDCENDQHFIKPQGLKVEFLIHPETLGQYTGVKDKNGVKIFEGDIIKPENYSMYGGIYFVGYDNGNAVFVFKKHLVTPNLLLRAKNIEVIGNIHQNPEILK